MHARPDVGIEPGVTIFVLKNHVKNNFGERLGHVAQIMIQLAPE